MNNTSGQGKDAEIPEGVKGWSWGAFLLNWIWGIGNSTYRALLVFVPVVGLVMLFVLGFKGREWAWRNRIWRDVEHFNRTQRKWSIAGLLIIAVLVPTCISGPLLALRNSSAYAMSLLEIQQSNAARRLLGDDISGGLLVMGTVSKKVTGAGTVGIAEITYSVSGDRSQGDVHVRATMEAGDWVLEEVILTSPASADTVDILRGDQRVSIPDQFKQI